MPFVNRTNVKSRERTPQDTLSTEQTLLPCHQGWDSAGGHDSTCTSPALLSAQHHWKDSSIPDESVAADFNFLTAGSSVRSPCMPWPCTENHHPNWGGLSGCAGSTVPALQCKSTLSHQGCSSTHPCHGCHGR